MKAVIMAAGLGTRLRPLTDTTPKPMLLVAGRPILEYTFDALPDAIDEVVLVVGYLQDQIRAHFGETWRGRRVQYVSQAELCGSGAAVSLCRDALAAGGSPVPRFLVLNGDDLYAKPDLTALVAHDHAMLASRTAAPGRFGALEADADGRLVRIIQASRVEAGALINAGAYVTDDAFFGLPLVAISATEYGLPQTMVQLVASRPVAIVEARFWMPIGRPDELARAEQLLAARRDTIAHWLP